MDVTAAVLIAFSIVAVLVLLGVIFAFLWIHLAPRLLGKMMGNLEQEMKFGQRK